MTDDRKLAQGPAAASFVSMALSKSVVLTATKVAAVVGTVLALINHGTAILELDIGAGHFLQIGLTYLVPYCVSTYSSVTALKRQSDHD